MVIELIYTGVVVLKSLDQVDLIGVEEGEI